MSQIHNSEIKGAIDWLDASFIYSFSAIMLIYFFVVEILQMLLLYFLSLLYFETRHIQVVC